MKVRNSPNCNDRSRKGIKYLILHYTGMETADDALDRLCDPKAQVSAHYLIKEDGEIVSMVPEGKRAWHAGLSKWEEDTDINDRSIGIELVNTGHPYEGYESVYKKFPDVQMDALIGLSQEIVKRHLIKPCYILGHSDVAWRRKIDPGELFDWQGLANKGLGLFASIGDHQKAASLGIKSFLSKLHNYGYDIEGVVDKPQEIITAFQRHYRPDNICGVLDDETVLILDKLLDDKFNL
ncbi:MAG: N-acetylmuramoyl-L-alanine amidase [Emcibacteraceae bacterium]|nr:N-acetylmuramoyl-L-alanine amidase [Emcibacteraceae bacterium]